MPVMYYLIWPYIFKDSYATVNPDAELDITRSLGTKTAAFQNEMYRRRLTDLTALQKALRRATEVEIRACLPILRRNEQKIEANQVVRRAFRVTLGKPVIWMPRAFLLAHLLLAPDMFTSPA